MRWLLFVLVVILLLLQFRLWFGEGSILQKLDLDKQVVEQKEHNQSLRQRNKLIAKEVESLKTNLDSIEEKARKDLGMIKHNETFYLVIDKDERLTAPESAP